MPWLASSAHAQTVEEFYKSHPITMLVGSGAGGGYDVYARVFARHFDRSHSRPSDYHRQEPAGGGWTCRGEHAL